MCFEKIRGRKKREVEGVAMWRSRNGRHQKSTPSSEKSGSCSPALTDSEQGITGA